MKRGILTEIRLQHEGVAHKAKQDHQARQKQNLAFLVLLLRYVVTQDLGQ